MIIEVTSVLAYTIQGFGVAAALLSLQFRAMDKKHMPHSFIASVLAGIILGIYSILTLQYVMVILNLITVILSYKGLKTWKKTRKVN